MTADAAPVPAPSIDRSRHEILVVNDDPASRYATARLLRSVGFRTREAASAAEALQRADESLSAVVLDIHLPDMDGFETCRVLRTREGLARLPVLHLSAAYVTDEDKVRGLDAGADAYLTHPVEPAVIVATVQALVRARIAEQAMRRSEARFRAIHANAPSGIGLLDAQGRLVETNKALQDLLAHDAAALAGHRVVEFVPSDWVERVEALLARPVVQAWQEEFPVVGQGGVVRHSEWRVSPLGEEGLRLAMTVDITDRIELERARSELLDRERSARAGAEHVNRMKDEMIAVLSHELRAPLNAIMSWVHVMQRLEHRPEVRKGLEAIDRNGRAQARLLGDILDASRINTGKLRLQLTPADPAELLTTAMQGLRTSIDERAGDVAVELHGPFQPIEVDRERFQQIVWNLLSNAMKFSPPGSPILVSLRRVGDHVRLTVSDQGQGIEPEYLPFIFDRFSQGDAGSNRHHGGLGLGLAIVRQLAQLHGGDATARSPGPGRGATFEVELPAVRRASDDAEAQADAGPETRRGDDFRDDTDELDGLQVLVVDDDADACTTLALILGERGARVTTARSFDDAIAALQRATPDVVVSDLGMPGRNGFDIIRLLRSREGPGQHLPAIALSAFTRSTDIEQALAAGFDRHCAKPLRPLELVRAIRSLCGGAAPPTG